MLKPLAKSTFRAVFLILAFPAAAACGFGRWNPVYTMFAQMCALAPGIPGDYLRGAFYRMTLLECSPACRISFGSFFAQRGARVAANVYIGSYCIIGTADIGESTQIASGVQILSGNRQHPRNAQGEILGSDEGTFQRITIGAHCWIGAACIVMADVGSGSTVSAGSVVSRPIPPNSIAVGSPARGMPANLVRTNP